MNSYTVSYARSFSVTDARKLASRVATDLSRMRRLYGHPSEVDIADFEEELAVILKGGYLERVTYGFKRGGRFIEPTVEYTAVELAGSAADDDPGRIAPDADIANATFSSYLEYNSAWSALSNEARDRVSQESPVQRVGADKPGLEGHFNRDLSYSAGGRGLNRSTLRRY